MSGTTSVPSPTFSATGFVMPAESAILAGVQADMNAAFGGNLNPGLSTPQGQLASSMAAIVADADATFLYYTTQTDPAFAQGRMQDAIARIYFITRNPAQSTVLQVVCTGLVNVPIPVGALVEDNAGNQYAATQAGVIPVGSSVTLAFACTVTGPVVCAAQTLTIYQAVSGWDTAVTLAAGVTGNLEETRAAFELRRQQSVAGNSVGMLGSILGAVLSVSGVLDAYVTDNATSAPVTKAGVLLGANSVYVAVVGGLASAIAQAIWSKKIPGCSYTGNTTVVVTDKASGYSVPYPTYNVTFQIPAAQTVLFAVTIANSSAVPANAAALIAAAIASAFTGGDGGSRERIGGTVYASRYYAPVLAVGAWVKIISILVGTGASATLNDVVMQINQTPVTAAANVSVSVM